VRLVFAAQGNLRLRAHDLMLFCRSVTAYAKHRLRQDYSRWLVEVEGGRHLTRRRAPAAA
jgi:hypothetical protein